LITSPDEQPACSTTPGPPDSVAQADWTCGNVRFHHGQISCSYDWDSLAAAPEPVLVGLAASSFTEGSSAGATTPTTAEVTGFLRDYEQVRSDPFSDSEQRTAAAAVIWVLAYNARCEVSFLPLGDVLLAGRGCTPSRPTPTPTSTSAGDSAYANDVVGLSLTLAGLGPRLVHTPSESSGTQRSPAVHGSPCPTWDSAQTGPVAEP
jgi:hypothetical protein